MIMKVKYTPGMTHSVKNVIAIKMLFNLFIFTTNNREVKNTIIK